MDDIRLVAIAEPVSRHGFHDGAVPANRAWPRVGTGEGLGRRAPDGAPRGPAGSSRGGPAGSSSGRPDALDRVMTSRLDRAGAAVRWGIGVGDDDASATRHAARALSSARERGSGLGFATGDPWRDTLLAELAPVLAALLDDLTPRQAEIARLILVGGARQADVAAALGVSRATISVAVARGRLSVIAGARRAIEALLTGPPGAGSGLGVGGTGGASGASGLSSDGTPAARSR